MCIWDQNLYQSFAIKIRYTYMEQIQVHLRGHSAMQNEPVTGPYHQRHTVPARMRASLFPRRLWIDQSCFVSTENIVFEISYFVDINWGSSMKSCKSNFTNYSPRKTEFFQQMVALEVQRSALQCESYTWELTWQSFPS